MRWLVRGLATAWVLAGPTLARADEPRYAFEADASSLFARMTTSKDDRASRVSDANGGGGAAVAITFRSPHIVLPFIDVSYLPAYRSLRLVDLGATAGGAASTYATLAAYGLVGGLALDVGPMRAFAGIGASGIGVRVTTRSVTSSTMETDMGYLVGLKGFLLRRGPFRVGLEARASFVVEASLTLVAAGVTLGYDAVRF